MVHTAAQQVCSKGNACLPCGKSVTDESHRPELERQLNDTEALIDRRQAQFTARFGEPMSEDNIWLAGAETTALRKILVAIDQVAVHEDGKRRAVRGAGAPDRPERVPADQAEGAKATEGSTAEPAPQPPAGRDGRPPPDRRAAGPGRPQEARRRRSAVTSAAVARTANVSTDFLYRHPELRPLIEKYRTRTTGRSTRQPAPDQNQAAGSTSAAVRALARKLEEMTRNHRTEITEMRKALEAARGENLDLRRKLATHTG
ncbi:hypothetical protein [Nonomuraea pusilla]|uniref:Uncharacterized protein n=1 Tax=Nonomuraea pusilla TaxID=46177 RepID=A0A1H8GCI6_9ACTN|nr:hypothetical protein [Nonomuraea pusilla]SEN41480.1 hypothetical protein SAMN05660976_07508 [Nonomuraea pusilla]